MRCSLCSLLRSMLVKTQSSGVCLAARPGADRAAYVADAGTPAKARMPHDAHNAPSPAGGDDAPRVPTLVDLLPDAVAGILLAGDDPVTAARLACTCRSLRDGVLFHPSSDPVWRRWLDRTWTPTATSSCCPPPEAAATPAGSLHPTASARLLFNRWQTRTPVGTHVWSPPGDGYTPHGLWPSPLDLAFGQGHTLCSLVKGQLHVFNTSRCEDPAVVLTQLEESGRLATLGVCICSGATLAAVGGADKAVRVLDTRLAPGADPVILLPGAHFDEVSSLAWCGQAYDAAPGQWSHLLATGGGDQTVRLWDLRHASGSSSASECPEPVMAFDDLPDGVTALAFDPDRHVLYAASGRDVCGLDTVTCEWKATLANPHRFDIHAVVVGTQAVLTCDDNGTVADWARLPPLGELGDTDEDEGIAPLSMLHMEGTGDGLPTDMTCLAGLGHAPAACLVGTWDGRVMLAQRRPSGLCIAGEAPFGAPWQGSQDTRAAVPVIALAAQAALVAVGHSDGAVRLMRLIDGNV